MSLQHVSKAARSSYLCVPSLVSWAVYLTIWITGAQRTVLEASLLIASMGNEMAPITVTVWHPLSYKYFLRSPPRTISHSFSWFALGFPPLLHSTHHQWRTKEALNVSALPPQREILHPATPKLHRRHHLDLRHHQGPRRRYPPAAPAHRFLNRAAPPRRL
jgi:hypothetical protein